jgi:hypothetical protein
VFVEHGGDDYISQIERQHREKDAQESDLAWIVANWPTVRHHASGATMGTLMALLGITEPWGRGGEGLTYYTNARGTFIVLDESLLTSDVEKVKAAAAAFVATQKENR